jgi:peptide chain release factor subunit 3
VKTGNIDQRSIEKYEKEAKELGKDSWFLAYILDSSEEERNRGITVEVARAHFETTKKRYTILDAPGHRAYVPNMISGASQADVAVLVISGRKGEFETGFEKDGQSREHATLVKTLGVKRLIVAINKMDDITVNWSEERYKDIVTKLTPFLNQVGYAKNSLIFIPLAAYPGQNITSRIDSSICKWYKGDCLTEVFDNLKPINRNATGPLRMPVMYRYKDMGVLNVLGKIEQGQLWIGKKYIIMPIEKEIEVSRILLHDLEVEYAKPGENIQIVIKGLEEKDISVGMVLCSPDNLCMVSKDFIADFLLLETKPMFAKGWNPIIHIHTVVTECKISQILEKTEKKTKKVEKAPPFVKTGDMAKVRITLEKPICIEKYDVLDQMGRFTLREVKTCAIGKVSLVKPFKKTN